MTLSIRCQSDTYQRLWLSDRFMLPQRQSVPWDKMPTMQNGNVMSLGRAKLRSAGQALLLS